MGLKKEIRLFDSQWTNIVNHENCYSGYTLEEAVLKAVKLAEKYMAENVLDNKWPEERNPQN